MPVREYLSIHGDRLGIGNTGEIVVDGIVLDVRNAQTTPAAQATIAEITTAGGTTIEAGTRQEVLQAIADLADPAA